MNLLLTIAIGDLYNRIGKLTHPSLKAYAKKIGADFLCISKPKISQTSPHWEKFQIFELFNKYDRVLYVDTDIIIRDDCPDLFELIPETKLGMFKESPFTERPKEIIFDVCRQYGIELEKWSGDYYNSGIMMISKRHRKYFKKPELEISNFFEQSYINTIIAKNDIKIFELTHEYNRMCCMDRFLGEHRRASYIIHYAGFPDPNQIFEVIKNDLAAWQRKEYYYPKNIYISVSGGLGDQACAEPAIRFMKKMYPDDNIIVATHFPRLFMHLNNVEIIEHGKANLQPDTPYYITETLPDPHTLQWAIVSHLLCHPVDYSSIALMHRTLPNQEKIIKLKFDESELQAVKDLIDDDLKNLILVHPGMHWESKSFPTEYWNELINKLSEKYKVCIIGKDTDGDVPADDAVHDGYYIAGARGVSDIPCPKDCYDLRNQLTLGELIALISQAKILISNDSAPIHIAGAFDNYIIVLPSCKHPDHILPYRNGSSNKNIALYKKLIIDEVESRPTQLYPTSVDVKVKNWNDYLIPIPDIIQKVEELA